MRSLQPDAPSLRQVQEWMAAQIVAPAGERSAAATQLDAWLRVPNPARVAERMHVYAGGYPVRVHDALAETYPAVARVAGTDAFGALAQRYAESVPLSSYNLNDAGEHLSNFLRSDPLALELPVLPDLAELEWRVARAFHAEERPALDPRALGWSMDDWASAVLHFQASVAVVSSVWPLLDLWGARDTPGAPIDVEPHDHPEHLVVRRVGLVVRCECVSADEAHALRRLLDSGRLLEATAQLEADGVDPATVMECFGRWIGAGMIAGASAS